MEKTVWYFLEKFLIFNCCNSLLSTFGACVTLHLARYTFKVMPCKVLIARFQMIVIKISKGMKT